MQGQAALRHAPLGLHGVKAYIMLPSLFLSNSSTGLGELDLTESP